MVFTGQGHPVQTSHAFFSHTAAVMQANFSPLQSHSLHSEYYAHNEVQVVGSSICEEWPTKTVFFCQVAVHRVYVIWALTF